MTNHQGKRAIYAALLTSIAVIISIIESSFPSPFAFAPGAKLGLANLIVLIALFTLNSREIVLITILRLLITALFTGFSVFLYSLVGSTLALLGMLMVKQLGPRLISLIGIAAVGGFCHNLGQLLVASLIAQTPSVLLYLPWLAFFGLLAGACIGIAANLLLYRVKTIYNLFQNTNRNWTLP